MSKIAVGMQNNICLQNLWLLFQQRGGLSKFVNTFFLKPAIDFKSYKFERLKVYVIFVLAGKADGGWYGKC